MSRARLFIWAPGQYTLAIYTEARAGFLTMRKGSLNLICSQFKKMWCSICKQTVAAALRMVLTQPWECLLIDSQKAQELIHTRQSTFVKENGFSVLEIRGAIFLGMNVTLLVKLFSMDCINSKISHLCAIFFVIFILSVYNVQFSLYQIHLKPFWGTHIGGYKWNLTIWWK